MDPMFPVEAITYVDFDMGDFNYKHLPPELQAFSQPFHDLAHQLADVLPPCREKLKALDRLLEAKDAAVRAARKQR